MRKHQKVKPVFIDHSEIELRQSEEHVFSPLKREIKALESEEGLPNAEPTSDLRAISMELKKNQEWVNLKKTKYRYMVLFLACLFQFFSYISD